MGYPIMKIISHLQSGISGSRTGWPISLVILLSSCLTGFLQAQSPPPEPPPAPPPQSAPQQLSQEDLNRLLAPIALYPDALVALILPASTVPSDLVLAARYISSNGDPAQVGNQPWDDSVKSLVRYPEVLKWMDQNLEWAMTVGEAFLDQPADVMNSIQRLRAEAIAAGNLTDTPQQHVVKEKSCVRIVPAQPDVIYVPQYDPDVVYEQPYSQDVGPFLTFGVGFAVGSWLNYDCDWDRRSIYVGQWRQGWNHDRNWDGWGPDQGRNWNRGDRGQNNNIVNVVNINSDTARQWQPSVNSQRHQAQLQRSNYANARFASVNALDANHQSGGPSTPRLTRSADPRANRIPKPSLPNITSRGNQRIRRGSQDSNGSNASPGSLPSSNVVTDAAPLQGRGRGSNPRNLSKHAQDSNQNLALNTSAVTNGTSETRGKNHKVPAPTVAPNVPGERGTPLQGRGQGSNPRNLSKHAQNGNQNPALNASAVTGTSGGRGKNHKLPAPAVAPNVPGGQGTPPSHGNGQGSAPRNLSKHAQGSNHSKGGANTQAKAAPSTTGASTQKHQKHVDHSQSSSPQSNNSSRPSNGQKHQQKRNSQSAPVAKQNKPSQSPSAHHDQHSQRSTAPPHQNNAPQPSNSSHGKGKGEKKTNEKKSKG
ncbi:MAG: DUF3300 domain-containing protein [Terrimicrobiaceae bacterium]